MHAPVDTRGLPFGPWAPEDLARSVVVEAECLDPVVDEEGADAAARAAAAAAASAAAAAEAAAREREAEEAARRAQEEAVSEAYARGRADGEREATEQLRTAVAAAEQALAMLRAGQERWLGRLEENICALAVAVARHIIARKVAESSTIVRKLVHTAIAEFPPDQTLRVRVHPDDLAAIEAVRNGTGRMAARDVVWITDPAIARGGCLVEGRDRIVDGRVDTALERIYRRLTEHHA